MDINELRAGQLVQHTTPRGTDLYQVCDMHPRGATLQWVYSRPRGGTDGHLPSRTTVVAFSTREVDRHLRPASTQMVNRLTVALDGGRAAVRG